MGKYYVLFNGYHNGYSKYVMKIMVGEGAWIFDIKFKKSRRKQIKVRKKYNPKMNYMKEWLQATHFLKIFFFRIPVCILSSSDITEIIRCLLITILVHEETLEFNQY